MPERRGGWTSSAPSSPGRCRTWTGQLELKIHNQSQEFSAGPGAAPPGSSGVPGHGDPQRFCVYDGAVHPLAFAGEPSGPVPVAATANRNVVSAGLGRAKDQMLAALVVTGADRQPALGGHRAGSGDGVDRSAKGFAAMSRPIWLRSTDRGTAGGAGGRRRKPLPVRRAGPAHSGAAGRPRAR